MLHSLVQKRDNIAFAFPIPPHTVFCNRKPSYPSMYVFLLRQPPTIDMRRVYDLMRYKSNGVTIPIRRSSFDYHKLATQPDSRSCGKLSANLESDLAQVKSWKNFAAFFSPPDARKHAELLQSQIPASRLLEAYAPGRIFRGYVVTDLPFLDASMDMGLVHGITSVWNSPARNILIFCILCVLGILVKKRRYTSLVADL